MPAVSPPAPTIEAGEGLAPVLRRNIAEMRARREAALRSAGPSDRIARRITDFAGSMGFVLLHLAIFGSWIGVNTLGPEALRFDPSLVVLAMAASVEAIFLSTFVLISQNRQAALDARRNDLDLQIDLLSEHEVTRMLGLVTAIAKRLGVELEESTDLDELQQDIAPEELMEQLESEQKQEKRTS
jgi:uncharacterized membrane protein